MQDKLRKWSSWLSWAEYWFNATFNQSAGMSPFKVLCGRDPPTFFKLEDVNSTVEYVNEHIKERNAVISELKDHLLKAQAVMKGYANKSRRDVHFVKHDLVYLKLKPYRLRSLAKKLN